MSVTMTKCEFNIILDKEAVDVYSTQPSPLPITLWFSQNNKLTINADKVSVYKESMCIEVDLCTTSPPIPEVCSALLNYYKTEWNLGDGVFEVYLYDIKNTLMNETWWETTYRWKFAKQIRGDRKFCVEHPDEPSISRHYLGSDNHVLCLSTVLNVTPVESESIPLRQWESRVLDSEQGDLAKLTPLGELTDIVAKWCCRESKEIARGILHGIHIGFANKVRTFISPEDGLIHVNVVEVTPTKVVFNVGSYTVTLNESRPSWYRNPISLR